MTRAIDVDRVKREIRKNKEKIVISCKQKYVPLSLIYEILNKAPTLTPPNEALPVLVNDEPDREYIDYICPRCKNTISQRRRGQRMETVYQCKFHDNCGQRVDWSDPRPYRRPPEGEEDT